MKPRVLVIEPQQLFVEAYCRAGLTQAVEIIHVLSGDAGERLLEEGVYVDLIVVGDSVDGIRGDGAAVVGSIRDEHEFKRPIIGAALIHEFGQRLSDAGCDQVVDIGRIGRGDATVLVDTVRKVLLSRGYTL